MTEPEPDLAALRQENDRLRRIYLAFTEAIDEAVYPKGFAGGHDHAAIVSRAGRLASWLEDANKDVDEANRRIAEVVAVLRGVPENAEPAVLALRDRLLVLLLVK